MGENLESQGGINTIDHVDTQAAPGEPLEAPPAAESSAGQEPTVGFDTDVGSTLFQRLDCSLQRQDRFIRGWWREATSHH